MPGHRDLLPVAEAVEVPDELRLVGDVSLVEGGRPRQPLVREASDVARGRDRIGARAAAAVRAIPVMRGEVGDPEEEGLSARPAPEEANGTARQGVVDVVSGAARAELEPPAVVADRGAVVVRVQ